MSFSSGHFRLDLRKGRMLSIQPNVFVFPVQNGFGSRIDRPIGRPIQFESGQLQLSSGMSGILGDHFFQVSNRLSDYTHLIRTDDGRHMVAYHEDSEGQQIVEELPEGEWQEVSNWLQQVDGLARVIPWLPNNSRLTAFHSARVFLNRSMPQGVPYRAGLANWSLLLAQLVAPKQYVRVPEKHAGKFIALRNDSVYKIQEDGSLTSIWMGDAHLSTSALHHGDILYQAEGAQDWRHRDDRKPWFRVHLSKAKDQIFLEEILDD